ncbi:hypothetical protein FXW78_50045 [Rhodococcus opacus]|nr:hypothetical protein [Rhodococcus opacus]
MTRTSKGGTRCPYCAGKLVIPGETDLATRRPDVAAEWHPSKNQIAPQDVTQSSNRTAWWQCRSGHEWAAIIANRTGGNSGCPFCDGRRINPGTNDLATVNPDLAAQWHPDLNTKTPFGVTLNSHHKAWWICENGHPWRATVASRAAGTGCPVCAGQKVLPGFNDLASQRPDITAEWHPTRNTLTPTDLTPTSNRKAWWRCSHGHEWKATVYNRTKGSRCPVCIGYQIIPGFNDLSTTHPSLGGVAPNQKHNQTHCRLRRKSPTVLVDMPRTRPRMAGIATRPHTS